MVTSESACLDDSAVAGLISGNLPSPRIAGIKAHIAGCRQCERLVSAAMSDLELDATFPSNPGALQSAADSQLDDPAYAPGTVIAGRYEIERTLGRGGMGSVVAAIHLGLRQRVAIKFMHIVGGDARARFLREGHILGQLRSPHVVRVYDSGTLEDQTPFIVMEYLEGSDIADRLKNGPIAVDAAVRYAKQVCSALEAAHAAGIVHRDLKPSNLFLAAQPDGGELLKVLDFGVSKRAAADDSTLTTTGAVIGTPLYMSPEQLQGSHDVDKATDIWSLGAILYELLTQRPPFHAASINALMFAIVTQSPKSPSLFRPGLPSELERIIMRCLEKEASARFSSAAELRTALERCDLGERPQPSEPVAIAPRPRPRSWPRYVGLALMLSLAAALGLWALRKPEQIATPAVKVAVETPPQPPAAAAEPSPAPAPALQEAVREPEVVPVKPAEPSKRTQRDNLDIGEILVR